MEGAVTGARGSLGQGGQVPQLAETWICRSEHVCKWSSPPFPCANCLSACPQEGGKGKERGNSKSSWLFAGSSGQRFAVEEDEISDENTTAFHRSSTVSAVFSSNPFPQWRGSPQRLCVIRQVILHNLLGGQGQFSHLAGRCANLPATPPYRFSNTGHRNCEWRGERWQSSR